MNGKIALEEHFNLPDFSVPQYVNAETMREVSRRLLDVTAMRLGEMDAAGIDYSLLSLNAPGVQAEPDQGRGVASARHVNDTLAQIVAANPSRYGGLATLPMQDPAAAAAELDRCATQPGVSGGVVHGYHNSGGAGTGGGH